MATTPTREDFQATDVPQTNDSSGIQQQDQNKLPNAESADRLQSNTTDLNSLRQSELKVTTGPVDGNGSRRANGTLLSVILVIVILLVAGSLFIASLRVDKEDKTKPSIAVGGEENGALGTKNKKRKK